VVQPYMTLLNGAKMPALGMGTWELSGISMSSFGFYWP
jgi:diketogulonate reductase-like aldo/keto reductase